MVIQLALAKGYSSISDLHEHTNLDIKSNIKSAAVSTKTASLIIPETFAANPLLSILSMLKLGFNGKFSDRKTNSAFCITPLQFPIAI